VSRAVLDKHSCCSADLGYLLLQIYIICLLLVLIGMTAVVEHPDWFGGVPATVQSVAEAFLVRARNHCANVLSLRAPERGLPSDRYPDPIEQATVLGAVKVWPGKRRARG
jgi:hypothetical protein